MPTDRTKPRRFFTPLRLLGFWVVAFAIYYLTPIYKAVGWLALDVPTLNGYVDRHMRDIHHDVDFVCLYTVRCDSGSADLEIQTELTPDELVAIRNDIWRRRFDSYCEGRTANIGLEHGGSGAQDKWHFGFGFGGASGFAAGGAFAANGAAPCTRDMAYWTREDGIIAGRSTR